TSTLSDLVLTGGNSTNTFNLQLTTNVLPALFVNGGSAADKINVFYEDNTQGANRTGTALSVDGHGGTLILHGESTQDFSDGDVTLTNQVTFTITDQTVRRRNRVHSEEYLDPTTLPPGFRGPLFIVHS